MVLGQAKCRRVAAKPITWRTMYEISPDVNYTEWNLWYTSHWCQLRGGKIYVTTSYSNACAC